jgi:hypothetical protein
MQLTYQHWTLAKTAEIIEEVSAMMGVVCWWHRGNAPRICAIARLRRKPSRAPVRGEKPANLPAIRPAVEGDRGRLTLAPESIA